MNKPIGQTIGQLLTFIPIYGWGWFRNEKTLPRDEMETFLDKPIQLRVQWVWKYQGQPWGVVAKSEQGEHPLSEKWISISCGPNLQRDYDFLSEPLNLHVAVFVDPPPRSDAEEGEWIGEGHPLELMEGAGYVCPPEWTIEAVHKYRDALNSRRKQK